VQEVGFVVEFLQAAVVSIDLGYLRHTLAEISRLRLQRSGQAAWGWPSAPAGSTA
jgi:hypothetical protein